MSVKPISQTLSGSAFCYLIVGMFTVLILYETMDFFLMDIGSPSVRRST